MTDKIKDLLAVLDLPEEEQRVAIAYHIVPKPWKHFASGSFTPSSCDPEYCRKCKKPLQTVADDESDCPKPDGLSESLADLAFRLKREADPQEFARALVLVYDHIEPIPKGINPALVVDIIAEAMKGWAMVEVEPIHWIISSLIAKELNNEDKCAALIAEELAKK